MTCDVPWLPGCRLMMFGTIETNRSALPLLKTPSTEKWEIDSPVPAARSPLPDPRELLAMWIRLVPVLPLEAVNVTT